MLCAGNQVGKSYGGGGTEVSFHATGKYPDWWPGRRFDKPVLIWTGSPTNETSKEIIQPILLGTEEPNGENQGTGMIPGEDIIKVTTRQAGVKGVADEILVRHVSGGVSRIALKTYEQGRQKWQGKPVDVVWLDEEPDDPGLYTEAVTRTQATGGFVLMTFTPLLGMTSIVSGFVSGDYPQKNVTTMTIFDATGGTWGPGTPWAGQEWSGHYTREDAERIVSEYEDWERDTRAMGVPIMGQGRVWPVPEADIVVPPFEIPRHWARISGCDFGIDHPAAGALIAWDRTADVVYLIAEYRMRNQTPAYHAAALNAWGRWIPVAWPHDGINKEKGSGRTLKDMYAEHGANMMFLSARYEDEKGGSQDREPGVLEMLERMQTGRFKVFSTCAAFMEEFRMYHRKDGRIVDKNDDVISAVRYALMMKRYATTEPVQGNRHHARPMVSQFA